MCLKYTHDFGQSDQGISCLNKAFWNTSMQKTKLKDFFLRDSM